MAKKCKPMHLSSSKIESIKNYFKTKPVLKAYFLESEVDLFSSNGLSKYIKPIVDSEKRLIYEK